MNQRVILAVLIYNVAFSLIYLEHLSAEQTTDNIIRAQCIIDHPKWWQRFLALRPQFASYGLHFVNHDPDVILCNRPRPELLQADIPMIILERKESAFLWPSTRDALKYSHVKAVFKNRVLRDKNLYNQSACDNSLHFKLVNDYARYFNLSPCSDAAPEDLEKIHCVLWSFDNSPYSTRGEQLKDMMIDFDQPRPIDVFFAGKTLLSGNTKARILYTWHRQQAIIKLNTMQGIRVMVLGGKHQALSYEDYINHMQQAKIVVSPWGTGEWARRDYEALNCGAVLVKPDTGFVQAIPDIYQNNLTYVPCKPDFSDLEEKIREILAHYDTYQPMRKYAKKVLVDNGNIEQLAANFVQAVRNALRS